MKKEWIATLVATLLLGGCAFPGGKTPQGSFPVEIVPTYPASVSSANAVRTGDAVAVSGTLRKAHEFHLPGSVEVIACGPDGRLLARSEPRIAGYTSHRGGIKEARFSAELPIAPPAGTLFRLRYHAPEAQDPPLSCP